MSLRLAAVISPLRRTLLRRTREAQHLPEIQDSQVELLRALPRGVVTTAAELGRTLGMRPSTLSSIIASAEGEGLIARRRSEEDRRRIAVLATPKAIRLFEDYDAVSGELIEAAVATLSPGDQETLAAAVPVLERLHATLSRPAIGDRE